MALHEVPYYDRPYDSKFREVAVETEPEIYEWERIPMFLGQLWYAVFARPTKVVVHKSTDSGFTMTSWITNNHHIAQVAFNIDGNEYLPRHNKLKCFVTDAERDFRGHKIMFNVNLTPGVYRDADLPYGLSITFTERSGKEHYVRLFRYASPTSTVDNLQVVLDMDNLYSGFTDIDPASYKIPTNDLIRISFNFVDKEYFATGGYDVEGQPIKDKQEMKFPEPKIGHAEFSNFVCVNKATGELKTHARARPKNPDGSNYQTDLGIATSFDDIANLNPTRIVEDMWKLGYRGEINHYLGISNYPKLKYFADTDSFQLDPETCLDEGVRLWHEDFFNQCVRFGFKCTFAISMEVFYEYVRDKYRHWIQLCQGFQVLDIDDEYIKIEGKHPYSSKPNPFLGGWEYQGLFNPDKLWAADIRFKHDGDDFETVYKVLEVHDVPNEDKTLLKLDKIFRGWYGDYSIGKPALTGYNPPSTFFNTCIEDPEGRDYISRAFVEVSEIMPPVLERRFQIGEPWFWDGSYQNGRMFVYDEPTKRAALKDGIELPIWYDKTTFTKQRATQKEIDAANWLRKRLGDFCQEIRTETRKALPDAKFSCLTFIPQVFTTSSELTPIVNFPFEQWRYPNFDFFQYEAYDSIITGDLEFTNTYLDYAFDKLGYPVHLTNYLGGFAPNKDPTGRVWRNIAHQLSWTNTKVDTSYRGMKALIWASTQVNRDSVMFFNDGTPLPEDDDPWTYELRLVSDWKEYARQDKFWTPSVYSVTDGVTFNQAKYKLEEKVEQWWATNPETGEEVPYGNEVTSRRRVVLVTQPAIGRKGSEDFAVCAKGAVKANDVAVFDYNYEDITSETIASFDWGDGTVDDALQPDVGDYADSGPEVETDLEGNETIHDCNKHTYTADDAALEPKVIIAEAGEFISIWLRDMGITDVDFAIFPIATEINLSHNDMTQKQMDDLLDKLMAFSDERARYAYRNGTELHLYIGQQSTDEHASPDKIEEVVRFFNNLGVRMVVHS